MPQAAALVSDQPDALSELRTCATRCLLSIQRIIFPPEYPYTSGMTRILRDNFADLYAESSKMLGLGKDDLVDRHRLQ